MSIFGAALQLAGIGWPVLPLHTARGPVCSCSKGITCERSAGKHPRTPHGSADATTDELTIRAWWQRWPDANLAVSTGAESGFFMVGPDGFAGVQALAELQQRFGPLPPTPRARSGSADPGQHYYFQYPPGLVIGNARCHRGFPIDVRGDGGYGVAPPSLHKDGNLYVWELPPWETPLAEAPPWLLSWCQKEQAAAVVPPPVNGTAAASPRVLAYLDKIPAAVSGGGGHDQTFAAARVVVYGFNLGADTGFDVLWSHYNPRCQPPWTEGELRHKCADADTKPCNKARGWLLEDRADWIDSLPKLVWTPTKLTNGINTNSASTLPSGGQKPTRIQELLAQLNVVEHFTHNELLDMELTPESWIVEGLIPDEGLTFLGGKKKLGKSWFCLQLAQAIATGAPFLDRTTSCGKVVYLCLEDGKRRLQSRLRKQKAPRNLPIVYYTGFPKLDDKGFGDFVELIDLHTPKLLIVDTLAAAKTGKIDENAAGPMADLTNALRIVAQNFKLAIVVTHHHGKVTGGDPGDDLRGSSAIAGAGDANLGLYREEGVFILRGEGRDLDPPSLRMSFDAEETWNWNVLGDSRDMARQEADRTVLDAVHVLKEADCQVIAEMLKRSHSTTADRLRKMSLDGLLIPRAEEGEKGRPKIMYRLSLKALEDYPFD